MSQYRYSWNKALLTSQNAVRELLFWQIFIGGFLFWQGNLFAGFDESFLARAEALAAVDYTGKNQFKPDSAVSSYYPMGAPPPHHMPPQSHHPGMSIAAGAVPPPPVYGTMPPPPPPPGIHHPSPLHSVPQCVAQGSISITESGADLMEQLSNPSHW